MVRAEELSWRQLERPGQFCMGVWEERTWAHEAEESSLLKSTTREQLVKALQAVVICEVWVSVIVL
jgi:hypothetical protein